MIANLHTHTARCGHAVGEDWEYAAAAYDRGIKVLGFSDHTPHLFPNSFVSYIRMFPEQLKDYADSVRSLAKKYAGKMEIHLGVEAENYPSCFNDTVSLLRDNGVEYMILGQHWIGSEENEPYAGRATDSVETLDRYCRQAIDAMETGLFTYFAHPDLIHFTGEKQRYDQAIRTLCRAANTTATPLEINLLGLKNGRHYPNLHFWEIAAEENCSVVLGIDAHSPGEFDSEEAEKNALEMIFRLGLTLIESPILKKI